jgi:hypothetical protein
VLIFTAICFAVTVAFKADVDAQAGAYATGVLALMTSATIAVTISARRKGQTTAAIGFALVTLIFIYTTAVNILEQPSGVRIALMFIVGILLTSLLSRAWRSTELRVEKIELDEEAKRFVEELGQGQIHIVANKRQAGDVLEYSLKEKEQRADNHIPSRARVLFFEVDVCEASEFSNTMAVKGVDIGGFRILRAESSTVPNSIAAFALFLRDETGRSPHVYFAWSEGNPIAHLLRYLVFGEGDTAPLTREVLRRAEPDPERRPSIHVGG